MPFSVANLENLSANKGSENAIEIFHNNCLTFFYSPRIRKQTFFHLFKRIEFTTLFVLLQVVKFFSSKNVEPRMVVGMTSIVNIGKELFYKY